MEQYTSEDARREWRRILNAVESGQQVAITRYGKKIAIIAPADWYDDLIAELEEHDPPAVKRFREQNQP